MSLTGEVVAGEYLAGVESSRFAIAGHHFALARQDDDDAGFEGRYGRVIPYRRGTGL
jgi:hypothetical protein